MKLAWQTLGGVLMLCCSATFCVAQSVVYTLQGDQPLDAFGLHFDTVGDEDGDGVRDLVVGLPHDSTLAPNAGRAVVYSGRTGLLIREWFGSSDGDMLGSGVAGVDDIDHDGIGDVLIGVPGASSAAVESGLARIVSGATGLTIRTHTWPFKNEGFGKTAWDIGDANNDGIGDYAIGSTVSLDIFGPQAPELLGFSGANGAEINGVHNYDPEEVAGAGDTNGDGKNEVLLAHGPQAQLINPANGGVFDTAPSSSDSIAGIGPAGDFDGDGLKDYVFAWGPVAGIQFIQIRSKPHGVLFSLQVPLAAATPGLASAFDGTTDFNHDGILDLLVGFPVATPGAAPFAGLVRIYSGTSGSILAEIHEQGPFEAFGKAVRVLGDTNGDGFPEFAVSAPGNTGPSNAPGRVRVLTLGPVPWSHAGTSVAGLAGTPTLTGTGSLIAGTGLAISLSHALQGAPAVLILGLAQVSVPFKGGVLGPSLDVVLNPVPVSGALMSLIETAWPGGIAPGTKLFLQAWIQDAGGPAGFSATDTLVATTPS